MPPKGAAPKGGAKGKAKGGGDDDDESPSGTCNQVKVRHILCEKHGKCMEALKEITGYETTDDKGVVKKVEPVKFNVVAQKYSEDKAKEVRACALAGADLR
jgi:NIMA-interacting peptidyl-prolyl cis-trans isomerase 4